VIMHPAGAADGIASDEARREIELKGHALESVVNPSNAMSSLARMEIYAGSYYARLLECLRAEFPVTAKAVSEEIFDEFAVGYLQRYPSTSYTLTRLGANFPQYLAETRPADQADWPDAIIELARLEWESGEVFDGPGAEELPRLDPGLLAKISPEQLDTVRLTPTPCLRLREFEYPVHRYFSSLRAGDEVAVPERERTWLAISRQMYQVKHFELSAVQYALLSSIVSGATLGAAIASAAEAASDVESLAQALQESFARWSAEGFFLSVESA